MIPDRIVEEIRANGSAFNQVVADYREQGYALESWQMQWKIIAVFVQVEIPEGGTAQ